MLLIVKFCFTELCSFPYEWSPSTFDVQMLRVGNLVMLTMPGEFTKMAGCQMRYAYFSKVTENYV